MDKGRTMAIVKKGARRIVVDGTEYRWRIRRKRTVGEIEDFYDGREGIVVSAEQAVENPGAILLIGWTQQRTTTSASISVTPSMVADAIRRARQEGWQPLKLGQPFTQWNLFR